MSSNPRTPSEPLIVHVGRCAGDRAAWWQRLRQLAEVVSYPNLSAALASPPHRAPRVTLLVQHHPLDGDDELLLPWRQLFPLTRCVVMQGPWVTGRFHTTPQSDGYRRFAWHEVIDLLRTVECYLQGYRDFIDWDTTSAASAIAFAYRSQTGTDGTQRPEQPHARRCPIIVLSQDHEFALALSAALGSFGWGEPTSGEAFNGLINHRIGLFDVSAGAIWCNDPLWHTCAGRVAIASFLQPTDRVCLRAQGFNNAVPKPVPMRTLLNQLQTISAARFTQAFPVRNSE